MKKALITGITGQDGYYLSNLLLDKNYEVHGLVRRHSSGDLGTLSDPRIIIHYGDLTDRYSLDKIFRKTTFDEVYHLGAQSYVKLSFENPELTFNVNLSGTLNLLNSIKLYNPGAKVYNACTSEIFGNAPKTNFGGVLNLEAYDENSSKIPRSPYGVAKLAAYNLCINYREAYNLFISNGILFNHECFYYETPIIIKNKNNEILIKYIGDLLPRRENVSDDCSELSVKFEDLDIWDGTSFVKLKTITRKKLSLLDKENQCKQITSSREGVVLTTPNHNFINSNKEKIQARDISLNKTSLNHGNFPKLPNNKNCINDFAFVLGLLCGDGHIGKDGHSFRLTNNDEDILNMFFEKLSSIYVGLGKRISEYPGGFGTPVKRIDISGLPISVKTFLRDEIYDRRTFHKKVPDSIINGNLENKINFIDGYYLADGLKSNSRNLKEKYKNFKTNSPLLAQGVLLLLFEITGQQFTICPEYKNDKIYYNINLLGINTKKGKNLIKNRHEAKYLKTVDVENQHVYDIETETGVLMAGIGKMVVGNSPYRGQEFVTQKIVTGLCKYYIDLSQGIEPKKVILGNLDAERDWGYAKDYCEAMYLMLQHDTPDDFVIATGKKYSVREFAEFTKEYLNKKTNIHISNIEEMIVSNDDNLRPTEVNSLIGYPKKAKEILNWEPKTDIKTLIQIMVDYKLNVITRSQSRVSPKSL